MRCKLSKPLQTNIDLFIPLGEGYSSLGKNIHQKKFEDGVSGNPQI